MCTGILEHLVSFVQLLCNCEISRWKETTKENLEEFYIGGLVNWKLQMFDQWGPSVRRVNFGGRAIFFRSSDFCVIPPDQVTIQGDPQEGSQSHVEVMSMPATQWLSLKTANPFIQKAASRQSFTPSWLPHILLSPSSRSFASLHPVISPRFSISPCCHGQDTPVAIN